MEYTFFEVKDNIITNAAVFADESTALAMGFLPEIEGKWIGDRYDDTPTNEELAQETKLLKAQLQAATAQSDFLEECLVEMAMIVYN